MEMAIISIVLGIGVYFKNEGLVRDKYGRNMNKYDMKTNGRNIYNSHDTINVRKVEQEQMNKLYEQSKNTKETNVFIPGPPSGFINNDNNDYTDSKLPIEFNENGMKEQRYKNKENIGNSMGDINDISFKSTSNDYGSGWEGISQKPSEISKLTGNVIEKFEHNNMTPYFGGSIKQNMDEHATSTICDVFTGNDKNYKEKVEIAPMFKPSTNVSNMYGTQSMDSETYQRYVVGNMRNNETPIEKEYVGPGLNKGYTSSPTGGFHQEETRDYVIPKKTNELRVKTNPKLSFNGRMVAGKKISRTGKTGIVEKNKPDSYSIWGEDRLFTTNGDCTGPTQRSKVVIKCNNRKTTELKSRIGPAGPTTFKGKRSRYGKTAPSFKNLLEGYGFRNLASDMWDSMVDDYGRDCIDLRKTENKECKDNTPANGFIKTKTNYYVKNNQGPRFTRKTNVVGNSRWASNIQGPHNRHKIYNPNDIAKTTIKETNIHDSSKLNFKSDRPSNHRVKDTNDIARTTIKETNLHDSAKLNLKSDRPTNNVVKDEDDIAKTTIKETTFLENYINNPLKKKDTGYLMKAENIKAETTHRETTSTDYTGDAKGEESGGYKIADPDVKNTVRQFTSDYEYDGIAGPTSNAKSMSYQDIYNSTIKSVRQDISKGRIPAKQGVKGMLDGSDMNVETKKNIDSNNILIDERGTTNTKVYNSLPKFDKCNETKDKNTLPNQDRLDSGMLNAFKENPYTQSLNSHAFS